MAENRLSRNQLRSLSIVLNRLIPAVDDIPAAGEMGLEEQILNIVDTIPRLRSAVLASIAAFESDPIIDAKGGLAALSEEEQDQVIATVESYLPMTFNGFLEAVYLAYYGDPRVHKRISWRSGPLQPLGFDIKPFDYSIIDKVKHMKPLWRDV